MIRRMKERRTRSPPAFTLKVSCWVCNEDEESCLSAFTLESASHVSHDISVQNWIGDFSLYASFLNQVSKINTTEFL